MHIHTTITSRRHGRAGQWRSAAVAVCAVGWGANQFASLLPFYREHLGVGAAVIQATFGLYAVGLVPGLLLGGPLSDRLGRRTVVLPALCVSMLASLVLMLGTHGVGWLFAGRLVAGIASGAAFSAGTAWLKELSGPPHDDTSPGTGARRATIAMTIGFGAGPLVAGLLAQWSPAPGIVAYLPHLLLTVVALPLAWRTPETLVRGRDRAERAAVAAHRHPRFRWVVLPLAPWVFAAATIALAYLPTLVAGHVGQLVSAFGGSVAAVTAFSGVLVQPLARRFADPDRPHRLLAIALTTVVVGLLVAALAAGLALPELVYVAAVVLGAGYGACMVFGLTEVAGLAEPHELAGLTALFQAFTYLGFAAPYLLAAFQAFASPSVLLVAVTVLAAITLALTLRGIRR